MVLIYLHVHFIGIVKSGRARLSVLTPSVSAQIRYFVHSVHVTTSVETGTYTVWSGNSKTSSPSRPRTFPWSCSRPRPSFMSRLRKSTPRSALCIQRFVLREPPPQWTPRIDLVVLNFAALLHEHDAAAVLPVHLTFHCVLRAVAFCVLQQSVLLALAVPDSRCHHLHQQPHEQPHEQHHQHLRHHHRTDGD